MRKLRLRNNLLFMKYKYQIISHMGRNYSQKSIKNFRGLVIEKKLLDIFVELDFELFILVIFMF